MTEQFNHSVAVQELFVLKGFVFACAGRDVSPNPVAPYGGLVNACDRLLKYHTEALEPKGETELGAPGLPEEEPDKEDGPATDAE